MVEERAKSFQVGMEADVLGRFLTDLQLRPLTRCHNPKAYILAKRALDVVLAGLALVVTSPFALLLALIILIGDARGSPIFMQYRIGKGGKLFVCYKFRSMYADAPPYCATSELDDPYRHITTIGRFIRRTSLDELPQLFNVLKGDMSFIGPRPLIPAEKEIHAARFSAGVYDILPGITGLAQIKGRDMIGNMEKVAYDVEYMENLSLKNDIRIFFATFKGVLGRENIFEGKRWAGANEKRGIFGIENASEGGNDRA